METFGQRFSRLRKAKGLTQEDVASKVGLTYQAVSKWENDLSAPDISILLQLSDILCVSVEELLGKDTSTKETTEAPATTTPKQKRDIYKCFLKLVAQDGGDKANIKIPIAVIMACLDNNLDINNFNVVGGDSGINIDFRKIIDLVLSGAIGEILNVEGENGEKVSIFVSYED